MLVSVNKTCLKIKQKVREMKAKIVLEFTLELEDDFKNTPAERQAIFNDLRDELGSDVELNRVSVFPQFSVPVKYEPQLIH